MKKIDIDKLKAYVEQGLSSTDIAKKLHVNISTLYRNKKYRDIISNRRFNLKDNKENIIADIKQGLTAAEIAEKYNCSIYTVYNNFKINEYKNK
jgi:transposase